MDSASRLAMTRRIWDVFSSRKGEAPTTVDGVNEAAGDFAGACIAVSMSRLMMRPLGPEPVSDLRSMPLSAAMRAAIGDTIMRPFEPLSFWLFGDGAGAGTAAG